MKYSKLSSVILGLVVASITWSVHAALPEPLDPREVSSMNFEQRLAHGRMIREEMIKATPDERKTFREKMHQKMQALSPQERKELHKKMHSEWKSLSVEQRDQLKQERKSMMEILTPQERKELREERKKWRDEMHRPAKMTN